MVDRVVETADCSEQMVAAALPPPTATELPRDHQAGNEQMTVEKAEFRNKHLNVK